MPITPRGTRMRPTLMPRRLLVQIGDLADGIGELRDLLQARRHLLDDVVGERQPVDEGRVLPPARRRDEIGGVRRR